jgi:hypothetical protein
MNWERLLLVAFLGNYLINNVIAAIASLIPAKQGGGFLTPQYLVYVLLAAILVGLMVLWYFRKASGPSWMTGLTFGVSGFVISIATTFISGISGVLAQSGSVAQLMSVLPNFGPFLWNWSTLILLGLWVIPSTFVGWWIGMKMMKKMPMSAPAPMTSQVM